jgi:hypothetical protein
MVDELQLSQEFKEKFKRLCDTSEDEDKSSQETATCSKKLKVSEPISISQIDKNSSGSDFIATIIFISPIKKFKKSVLFNVVFKDKDSSIFAIFSSLDDYKNMELGYEYNLTISKFLNKYEEINI